MNPNSVHLLHVFPTFAVGGAQMRFARLVEGHGDRYRHTVIALDHVLDMASRLPMDGSISYRTVTFEKNRLWANLLLFRRTINEVSPDALVTYNWGAIEWALANRGASAGRHVHIEDGFGPEESQHQLQHRVWLRRLSLSGPRTTIVLPSRGLEQIALHTWKLPATRVLFIPNGIDCERFAVDVDSRRRKSGPLIVGTVATLRREKNISRLINAFCAVAAGLPKDHVQLLIVGDGPEAEPLKRIAAKTSFADRITFAGATAKPQDWYRKMDVFALSSDTEQMPFSVLEAMASGLPIVATAVGDVPALVAPDNAQQIVRCGDEFGYQAALGGLLANTELRMRLGRENQHKVQEQFDERLMIKRYAEVFG